MPTQLYCEEVILLFADTILFAYGIWYIACSVN